MSEKDAGEASPTVFRDTVSLPFSVDGCDGEGKLLRDVLFCVISFISPLLRLLSVSEKVDCDESFSVLRWPLFGCFEEDIVVKGLVEMDTAGTPLVGLILSLLEGIALDLNWLPPLLLEVVVTVDDDEGCEVEPIGNFCIFSCVSTTKKKKKQLSVSETVQESGNFKVRILSRTECSVACVLVFLPQFFDQYIFTNSVLLVERKK